MKPYVILYFVEHSKNIINYYFPKIPQYLTLINDIHETIENQYFFLN